MKLINKLITKTAIYKHLKDLYEQALKDVERLQEIEKDWLNYREKYNNLIEEKNKLGEEYHELEVKYNKLTQLDYMTKIRNLENECNRLQTLLNTEKMATETTVQMKVKEFKKDFDLYREQYEYCFTETRKLKQAIRRIRVRVNKLDKKDENVNAIKELIKEVLN